MKKIFVCKHCGSTNVAQDATYFPNSDSFHIIVEQYCFSCNKKGCRLIVETEVPDDFEVRTARGERS